MTRFRDRTEAGEQLASQLASLAREKPIVIALPRGGVPVAFPIARALNAPLDVLVARKLGVPGYTELGMGAVAEGGAFVLDHGITVPWRIGEDEIERARVRELAELERRASLYRGHRPPIDLRGRTVILVDDGLATGVTARAAIRAVRARGAKRIVFAAPVCAPESAEALRGEVDLVVCAAQPTPMKAVGLWYDDFSQTSDAEVLALLERANGPASPLDATGHDDTSQIVRVAVNRDVRIDVGGTILDATLSHPAAPTGLVLFAHGSGSSRFSTRNRYVAGELNRAGLGTLLFDLLSREEEVVDARTHALRFAIDMLSRRLVRVTDWAVANFPDLPLGYFGASTGAAAALVAAAERADRVHAVVSRGGRPDLAGTALARVQAPTLLIVGSDDEDVLGLNHAAIGRMNGHAQLSIVPGAGHLFEEPGALTRVAELARQFFLDHIRMPVQAPFDLAMGAARDSHARRV
jgi:putative phosphoribosyl transferase